MPEMGPLQQSCQSMQAGVDRVAEQVPGLPADDIKLSRMLHIVSAGMEAAEEAWLKAHQLGLSEFRTLIMLYSSPGQQAHPSDLCQWATLKPTNMTRIVDALLQRGLVTRRPSDKDRRCIILEVTPDGARLIRKLLPMLHPNVTAMLQGFSRAEHRQMGILLQKLIDNIDAMDNAPQ
jgi:MarR family transcriptional repressor of emrRAB